MLVVGPEIMTFANIHIYIYDLFGRNFIVTYYMHSMAMMGKRINRESIVPTDVKKESMKTGFT